jgi:acyl carrier protein
MGPSTSANGIAYPQLAAIFEDVFQYSGPLAPSTSPDDVSRWDSLQHIALVRCLEETFAIQLSMDEMMEIRTVADIENVLRRHGVCEQQGN